MAKQDRRVGVLLVNLGTPDSPNVGDVRKYLREFLSDPRVIDIPALGRWLLLNLVILPRRPKQSAAAYRLIWGEEGSPLWVHTEALGRAVSERLGADYLVQVAMRYQSPSIETGLEALLKGDVREIVVFPLFPQYASAASGSALERVYELVASRPAVPAIRTIDAFYEHPSFVEAVGEVSRPHLDAFRPDYVLFSYHGLPERQVRACDATKEHCFARPECCDSVGSSNRDCYRAQCFATTRAVAAELKLDPEAHGVSFQSRLGRTPWIQPFTDVVVGALAQRGVRRLAVLCPSFVADCLETLEEIGIRLRQQWTDLGGEELTLIPCVNSHPRWAQAVEEMVRGA